MRESCHNDQIDLVKDVDGTSTNMKNMKTSDQCDAVVTSADNKSGMKKSKKRLAGSKDIEPDEFQIPIPSGQQKSIRYQGAGFDGQSSKNQAKRIKIQQNTIEENHDEWNPQGLERCLEANNPLLFGAEGEDVESAKCRICGQGNTDPSNPLLR